MCIRLNLERLKKCDGRKKKLTLFIFVFFLNDYICLSPFLHLHCIYMYIYHFAGVPYLSVFDGYQHTDPDISATELGDKLFLPDISL